MTSLDFLAVVIFGFGFRTFGFGRRRRGPPNDQTTNPAALLDEDDLPLLDEASIALLDEDG